MKFMALRVCVRAWHFNFMRWIAQLALGMIGDIRYD